MPATFEDILYEVAGGRATITINRPDRLNAFRGQTIRELCEAFEAAADDEAVGVIVFTGAGERAFCVGGDVRDPTRTAAEKRALHHLHDRLGGRHPQQRQADHPEGARLLHRRRQRAQRALRPHHLGRVRPLRPGRPEDRLGAPVVGLPAAARGGRREEGARDPLPHPPVHGRGGARDGPDQRGRPRRRARRRGQPLVRPDPAPLPPGPAAGQDRHERLQRRPLLGRPARRRAGGAQPRLRPGAPGGHRQLPGEAPADWRKFRDGQGPEPG